MNKTNESALSDISRLISQHGWGLRRASGSKIIVTHADGSGVVLNEDDENNSIAETLLYRMMDDFLTAK